MQERILEPYNPILCTGEVTLFQQPFRNWTTAYHQWMDLPQALETSCDTYFYELGRRFYVRPDSPLQDWARRFGFGRLSGIDIGPEDRGLVPTPAWRRKAYEAEIDRIWKPGYSIQLAIGQAQLTVTPLQMARFYALIANGGKLVEPHLVQTVERPAPEGERAAVLRRFAPAPPRSVGVDSRGLAV